MHASILQTILVAALALAPGGALAQKKSPGCGKANKLKNGVQKINVGGTERQYILQLPDNYDSSKARKLIFGFHWRGATMDNIMNDPTNLQPYYGLRKKAGDSAIFVAPDGLNKGWENTGGRDVAFVDAMIKQIEDDLCVDQSQRFAAGFSFGGAMSFSLACSRGSQFRAVAVQGAGEVSGCDGPKDPIAYLAIHGIDDGILPLPRGIEIANKIAKVNGCTQDKNPATPAKGSKSFKTTDFKNCKRPVRFVTFDGGHDTAPLGVGSDLQPGAIWDFFNQA